MDITDIELGRQQWQTLKLGLDALDGTPQSLHGFAAQARAAQSLHKALPHQYEVVSVSYTHLTLPTTPYV